MSLQADLTLLQNLQTALQSHGASSKILGDVSLAISDLQLQIGGGPSWYASPSGSDSNPGTLAQPFKTIAKGLTKLTPNSTLYLRAGTYPESINDSIPSGTSWSAPVTISAYNSEAAIIQAQSGSTGIQISSHSYIQFLNLILDGAKLSSDNGVVKITYSSGTKYAHHIRLQNCEIRNDSVGSGVLVTEGNTGAQVRYNEIINCYIHDNGSTASNHWHGVYLESSYNIVSGCDIANSGAYGIQIYADAAVAGDTFHCAYNVVNNCKLHGSKIRAGIIVSKGTGNQVYNCVVYNNATDGIYLDYGAAGTLVAFNTCWNNAAIGVDVVQASNTIVRDNIEFGNGTAYHDGGTGTSHDHDFTADPKFVNSAAGDFHLKAGSPAIGAGVSVAGITTDFDGVVRANPPSIGAYEV